MSELLEAIQRHRTESQEAAFGDIVSAMADLGDDVAAKDNDPAEIAGTAETFAAFCARMKMDQAMMTADQFRAATGLYDATCGKQKVAASAIDAEIVTREYTDAFLAEMIRLGRQDALEARGHRITARTKFDDLIAEIRSASR